MLVECMDGWIVATSFQNLCIEKNMYKLTFYRYNELLLNEIMNSKIIKEEEIKKEIFK